MCGRDRKRRRLALSNGSCVAPEAVELACQPFGERLEIGSSFREGGPLSAADKEACPDPVFERAYAAAKGRLRDMSGIGCSRKRLEFRQSQKIFKPVQFHKVDAVCA